MERGEEIEERKKNEEREREADDIEERKLNGEERELEREYKGG